MACCFSSVYPTPSYIYMQLQKLHSGVKITQEKTQLTSSPYHHRAKSYLVHSVAEKSDIRSCSQRCKLEIQFLG